MDSQEKKQPRNEREEEDGGRIVMPQTDTHCHTVASTHAYSTVLEMAQYAAQKGLRAIAVTDHGPALPDGAHEWHFANLRCLPPYIEGVRVLHGAEANILGKEGKLDLSDRYQEELDWVIASFHEPAAGSMTQDECTQAYLAVAQNPYVDVIGHSGTEGYRYDYVRVIPVFGKTGKLVEINSHSFECRQGAPRNCREIALLCKEHRVRVVVNSDAHVCFSLGNVSEAVRMLREIDFPPELIVNTTLESLAGYIAAKRHRQIL